MLWAVGAIINVIGSVMINLGTNIIKLGHTRTARHCDEPECRARAPRLLKSPGRWWRYPGNKVWLAGMLLFSIGNILNFASFAFAAQSLLSALGVVQFVSNIIFGRFVNKEKVTKRVLFATAVVCTGCVLLVLFGNHESPTLSTADMLDLYSEPLYIAYLCLVFTLSPLFYYFYRRGKRAIVGDRTGAAARRWARWLPICYALFAGPIGTQSVMYGKTISMLLRTTFSGDSQLASWYTWVSLLLFLAFAGFWMSRYSKAMKLFPVLIIMPIIQIVWILFSMVSGSIYFQEYKTLNALSGTMFGVGVVVELVGVWILTGGQAGQPPPQPLQPESSAEAKKATDLSEEDGPRGQPSEGGADEQALRRASAPSDGEVLPGGGQLDSDEAMVARKLSTVYEPRSMGSASSAAGAAQGPRRPSPPRRPGSRTGRRGGEGEGSEGGSDAHAQLMEEGAVDSSAALGASAQRLAGSEKGPPAALPGAAAAAGAAAEPQPTSFMHDLRSDWGVGVADLSAVMRASVGVYQDEDEATAFSIWSLPMATQSFTAAGFAPRRHSIADLPASSTFRVRSAFEAQLAARHGTAPSPPGGGADSSQGTPHVTVDDGLVGSARARRPGHRRLNRSRSANELDDILREAGLDQLGVPEPGAEWPSGDSPWRAATSSLVGPSGGGGAAAGAAAAADGATPTSRLQHVRTPSNLRAGSAPVLSSVLLGDFGLASSAAAAGPTLSSPHTAPRRPHLVAPPPGVAAAPMSPFSAGSELGESPSPQAAPREGGLPASDFLAGADSDALSPSASFTEMARKGDKAA